MGMADAIRAELTRRVAGITARLDNDQSRALARDLDEVRALAHAHGLEAAAAVAPLISLALASGGQRAVARGWLAILSDAVASERHDPDAARAYAGACSIRLAV
jgi:hypothetical protein